MSIRFDGKVAIVTGAGAGLGRAYAIQLAARGAKVVVNDLGPDKGQGRPADNVVKEIKATGGEATANYDSVVDGEKVVATALNAYGGVHIIVNNAGILRDMGFHRMNEANFKIIIDVHLYGTKNVIKAAWETMRKQKYGRIVNVTSINGLYGQRGPVNYASAKAGIVGMSKALAKEGKSRNIKVNVVAPGAGSAMTATIMPADMVKLWKPEYVAPLVSYLAHETVPCSGKVFEAGGGWYAEVQYRRSPGLMLNVDKAQFSPEEIEKGFGALTNFAQCIDPEEEYNSGQPSPSLKQVMDKMSKL